MLRLRAGNAGGEALNNKIEIGTQVRFKDEFGRPKIGTVVNLDACGAGLIGINAPNCVGGYVRRADEVDMQEDAINDEN